MYQEPIQEPMSTTLLQGVTNFLTRIVDRYLPDPLVIVILLTIIMMACCIVFQGNSPQDVLEYWTTGFSNLHAFAMQMVLILIAGYVVATTPLFQMLMTRVSTAADTPSRAIIAVTLTTMATSWLNWGIGLVVGAVLAKELARRVPTADFRLLVAGAYAGFMVNIGGLSGAVFLSVATPGHPLESLGGIVPASQTIFSPLNLVLIIAMFIVIPLTTRLMMGGSTPQPMTLMDDNETLPHHEKADRPAEKLEQSRFLALTIALIGGAGVALYFFNGGTLNLNIIIFALIFAGIGLHGSLALYMDQLNVAVKNATGIIIQFPFYAGLMGLMAESGLANDLAETFVQLATAETLPFWSFISAGLINMAIPSGGGQWAVQGPVLMEAAQTLHADVPRVIIAFAWGDTWTNLIQPFWALPVLAIAGLRARDIMGHCAVLTLVTGAVITACLVFV